MTSESGADRTPKNEEALSSMAPPLSDHFLPGSLESLTTRMAAALEWLMLNKNSTLDSR